MKSKEKLATVNCDVLLRRAPPRIASLFSRFPVIYLHKAKSYVILDASGRWIDVNQKDMIHHLIASGVFDLKGQDKDDIAGIVKTLVVAIHDYFNVDVATSLAGHFKGVLEFQGKRVLVVNSPRVIQGRKGKHSIIEKVGKGLLGGDQWEHHRAWLKLTREALQARVITKLQGLVFVGERDCGKSRIQNWLITPVCGDRSIDPWRFIQKNEDFTAPLFRHEHLMIEDSIAGPTHWERQKLANLIKQVAGNDFSEFHPKFGDSFNLPHFWRFTLSVNNEPEYVRILPVMDSSLEDKMSLYFCERAEMPMRTYTLVERLAFEKAWRDELPAWLYDLDQWKIPERWLGGRDGLICYHNEKVLRLIQRIAPEQEILEILIQFFKEQKGLTANPLYLKNGQWQSMMSELENAIRESLPALKPKFEKLFTYTGALGTAVKRLSQREWGNKVFEFKTIKGSDLVCINVVELLEGSQESA